MSRRLRSAPPESGVTAVVVCIVVVVLFGFTALAIDVARMYEERRELQRTADAAALSGATKYAAGNTATSGDPCGGDAAACANYYIDQNPARVNSIDSRVVQVPGACTRVIAGNAYPCVHVEVRSDDFEFTFARVLGFDTRTIDAAATAIIASGAPEGARLIPWLLVDCPTPSLYPDEAGIAGVDGCPHTLSADFTSGPFTVMYEAPGGSSRGNFDAASWDPAPNCPATADGLFGLSGGSDYFDFLKGTNSSQRACRIDKGARIFTKPGYMGQPTDSALDERNGAPGVSGCMNEASFDSAVEVVDASTGLVSITDYTNPCLVAVPLVVHGNASYPGYGTDVPGGCCVDAMQDPDPATRLEGLQGRDEVLIRRFGLFYITQRGGPGDPFNYRGLFMKTVDSLETTIGGTGCTPLDGICVVKLVE